VTRFPDRNYLSTTVSSWLKHIPCRTLLESFHGFFAGWIFLRKSKHRKLKAFFWKKGLVKNEVGAKADAKAHLRLCARERKLVLAKRGCPLRLRGST
jgi:hypothetical protein